MLAIEVSRWWDSLSSYVPHSVMHINQFMWSIIRRSWLTLLDSLQLYPRRVSIIITRISRHGGVTPHGRRTCYATMTGDRYSCDFLDQPILILTIFLSLRNQVLSSITLYLLRQGLVGALIPVVGLVLIIKLIVVGETVPV
jgi:hypothetical protein